MKIRWFFVLFLTFFCISVSAQYTRGKVVEGEKIASKVLGKDVRYTVYLPFDYDSSERYYPVVYLLHGFGDNDMGWVQFGEINMLCDKAIAENEIPPMIIVMPDAGVSFYVNNYDGSVSYEDFFIKEFMPYIESEYRIRTDRRYRGVAGLSMGGFGTLNYSLKYPDLFSGAAALSSGVFTDEEILAMEPEEWDNLLRKVYGDKPTDENSFSEHYQANNILGIIKNINPDTLKSSRFYIDCGDDDFLIKGNMALHSLMIDKGINHEFRVRNGSHQWSYWRTGIIEGLKFIGESFHQP